MIVSDIRSLVGGARGRHLTAERKYEWSVSILFDRLVINLSDPVNILRRS